MFSLLNNASGLWVGQENEHKKDTAIMITIIIKSP